MTGCPTSDYWAVPSRGYYLPQFSRRPGIVHCQRSCPVEGVGGFGPSTHMPECPPLFPPLVPSTRGKVVSAALGAPPPEINADGIGPSLTTDRDEESVLSDSYSDRHSTTADSSIMWGRHLGHSSEQKPRTTERRDKDSYRSSDKDRDRNRDRERDRSKKGDIRHGSERPASALHDAKTMTVSAAAPTSVNVRADMRALSMTAKQSRGAWASTSPRMRPQEVAHPLNIDLCHLHQCCIPHL